MSEEINGEVVPKKISPLPKMKIFLIFSIFLIHEISMLSIFPYLSPMTIDLLQLDEKKDGKLVGYYSGFIASSFFIANFIFSYFIF
jgi:hypothetical protein